MVISVFHGIQSDYVQVVCFQERYHEKLEKMGWVKDPELLPAEWPQLVDDVEQLEIIVGSQAKAIERLQHDLDVALKIEPSKLLESHESLEDKVKSSDSKDEIEVIIKNSFGVDLDKRGALDTVKEKALKIIEDSKPAE